MRLRWILALILLPVFGYSQSTEIQKWWNLSKPELLRRIKGVRGTDVDDPFYAVFQWAQHIDETYPGEGIYYVSNFESIQAAIDSAHANGGGKVIVECDTVVVTSPIRLYSNIWLSGLGGCSVIMSQKSSTGSLPVIQLSELSLDTNVVISDLVIVPDPTPSYAVEWDHAIDLRNARKVYVHNVRVPQCVGDGVYVRGCRDVIISGCYFGGVDISGAYDPPCPRNGVAVVDARNVLVTNNTFFGSFDPAAVDVEPNANQEVWGVVIANNTIEGNDLQHLSQGISVYANAQAGTSLIRHVVIANNVIRRVYARAINVYDWYRNLLGLDITGNVIDSCGFGASPSTALYISGGPASVNFSNNIVRDCTYGPALFVYDTYENAIDGLVISGNVFENVRYGIYLYRNASYPSPRNVVITGNTIRRTVYDGIDLVSIDGITTVALNTMTDIGRYGVNLTSCDSVYCYLNTVIDATSTDYYVYNPGPDVVFDRNIGEGESRYSGTVADMYAQQDTMVLRLRGQDDTKAFAITSDHEDSLLFVVNGYGTVKVYNRAGTSSFPGRLVQWWFADPSAPQLEFYVNNDTVILYGNDTKGWAGWPQFKTGYVYGRLGFGTYPGYKIYLDDDYSGGAGSKDSYIWYNSSRGEVEIYDDGVKVFPLPPEGGSGVGPEAFQQTYSLGSFLPIDGTANGFYLYVNPVNGLAEVALPAVRWLHGHTIALDSVFVSVSYDGTPGGTVDSIAVKFRDHNGNDTFVCSVAGVGEGIVAMDVADLEVPDNSVIVITCYDTDPNWQFGNVRLRYIW